MRPTKSDIEKVCLSTEANKTFCLLKVKRVFVRLGGTSGRVDIYEILIDGGIKMAATALHAFTCLRDAKMQPLRACDLKKDDAIWVDVGQFLGDGSFTKEIR